MRAHITIYRFFVLTILVALMALFGWAAAFAQDSGVGTAPNFTTQDLEVRIAAASSNADLSSDQQAQIKTSLEAAADRLAEAIRQTERSAQYVAAIENADEIQAELDEQLEAAQKTLEADKAPIAEMIGDDALFELERELFEKSSRLAQLDTRLLALQESLNALSVRQTTAPQELAEARAAIGNLQTRINAMGDSDLEPVSNARRTEVQARIWYRRNQIRALEQELATLPKRQELLMSRRAIADIDAQILRRDVARLSARTGQKRLSEAREQRNRITADLQVANITHPLIQTYATESIALADKIADIAAEAPSISQATASAKGRVVDVENDLNAAQNLVEQGRLDREVGDTLRRLGDNLQMPKSIRVDIREARNKRLAATRERIIAQEDLRDLPNGSVDLNVLVEEARKDDPSLEDFTPLEEELLSSIIDTRRDLLRQITTLSNTRINSVSELQAALDSLLVKTESLQTLLDENLIWVRSVPAVGTSFPQKVALGAISLFSPQNLTLAVTELLEMARAYVLVIFGFFALIALIFRLRPGVREDVQRRAGLTGRVTQDSVWHTPVVIAAGVFNSMPLALIFLLIATLYWLSGNPDSLIEGLANGFGCLSAFALIYGAWLRWQRDGGLLEAHFNFSDRLRSLIATNLRWFGPLLGTLTFFLALTNDMTDENIEEGFSVFVFMLTGLSVMIFAIRILWAADRDNAGSNSDDRSLVRYRGILALGAIGLPFATMAIAAAGYYESANALLSRMFLTAMLILLTYVLYGAIRRAIVVTQRQLKYRQALKKREKELQARREKEAAKKRGDDAPPAPPPVDTTAIDVTTLTRQSSKLLQTVILLGFAGLLWMIWSALLPALSIFDGFEVWTYQSGLDVERNPIEVAVSLWDILRSLVIFGLTFIAARNLPGFLEIFVLNRMGVDAGSRYAVKTVLGYIIVGIGVIIGFNQLGLQWSQLKWIVTGLSVGIGLGLQKIIANFVSGLIILFERPIRIGDYVTIGDQSGIVSRIKIRATTLNDLDNLEILIPNEAVISERVTNWTLSNSITRLIVRVGIAYGSDTELARDLIMDTIKTQKKILDTPAPQVLFTGFGDSSLDFEIRVFLRSFDDRAPMRHTLHTEINKALEAADISIPFPQRDLNIVSQNIPLEVLSKPTAASARTKTPGSKPAPKSSPKASPKTSKS